jgi:hypothetical protein
VIVLGDNPFFGVNHASVKRSREYFAHVRSRDWSGVHATMRAALEQGVSDFMVSTHAEAPDLLASMSRDGELRRFGVIPAVPYLHRLNGLVASRGMVSTLARSVSYPRLARELLVGGRLRTAGLLAFIDREIRPIVRLGFDVPAIALQNIFVDLLLGLGLADVINGAATRIRADGRQLIAITMNPLLADRVLDPSVVVCTHYNHLGFLVQPDLVSVQEWVVACERPVWAMGVLASGRAQLTSVMADKTLREFSAVVVGASRPASIEAFAKAYAHRWKRGRDRGADERVPAIAGRPDPRACGV